MKDFSPKTLQEAIKHFSDEQVCIETFARIRWADGKPECPACGHREHYYLAKQRRFKCKECWKQFTVKVGTLLEDSPIPLSKWLPALWMIVNDKNGISSYELGKALGITQKSAWFVLHRLRTALRCHSFDKMGGNGGTVEVDETFVGGRIANMHKSKKERMATIRGQQLKGDHLNKTIVMGLLDRDLRQVRAKVVPNVKRETLQAEVLREVEHGSNVYTDEWIGYKSLREQFVHLDKYVDEQVFRFNNRGGKTKETRITDSQRFELALSQVAGKRLTFDELTGKI